MFNALNRFMSRLDGDAPQRRQHDNGSYGFQVLRNTNLDLPIEPWFDFVGQRMKEMHIPVPVDTTSLGLSLQWAPIALAANVWHVLDVAPNSPADQAPLLPYSDYILGSPEGALNGEAALGELVEDFIGRPLRLYVYNNEYNVAREVTIQPRRDWGGEGALGCVLGYGALHRLPAPLSEPVNPPGDTMFDGADGSSATTAATTTFVPADSPAPGVAAGGGGDYLVPAQMVGATPVSAPPRSGKKKDRHATRSPLNGDMDDYFREGEAKSKELDRAPKSKGSAVPPPPRAGAGPPRAAAATPEAS
ncbi:hypothetical protein GMORB2_6141 [Geosmithia morbida]|uniref:PDZ GRASP-type domain-containing protein n=1 Tax=Geosmithia morbida TaxID=1094350 RepID=A0A9P5D556_9HYPO|nr:uncharacterized protein GMORB2_6141 [Geosmithia morbida]KAF4123440.1 hypothetical protein GMORB2_6141 [Geosmithia morbida]